MENFEIIFVDITIGYIMEKKEIFIKEEDIILNKYTI